MLPEPVLERCACIFAWFKQNNRPVFQVEGRAVEGSIFKVPGQMVVFFPTTIHGPSYKEPANHRNIDHLARVAVDERLGSRAAG